MKHVLWIATTTLLAFLGGCGGESGPATYPVTGTVTFDGQPLRDGEIIFRDVEGKLASAAGTITDGAFAFESLPGPKRVEITAYREVPGKFDESNPGVKTPLIEQYVPGQYNDQSELTADVSDGDNSFTFDLTSQ